MTQAVVTVLTIVLSLFVGHFGALCSVNQWTLFYFLVKPVTGVLGGALNVSGILKFYIEVRPWSQWHPKGGLQGLIGNFTSCLSRHDS